MGNGVCMGKSKNISGTKKHETIINELIALYKKRPAFMDELSKVK